MGERSVESELTEDEMLTLGFEKCGDLYVARDSAFIIWTRALPNGNAPVGGEHYSSAPLARCA